MDSENVEYINSLLEHDVEIREVLISDELILSSSGS